jgi:HPt (histidine-containing phosphotransfer) domain-containing protein
MIDELRARFLPRFVQSARRRLENASQRIAQKADGAPAVAADLHTIAGEASVLGLAEIAAIAREGECVVRQPGGLDDPDLLGILFNLRRGLDELGVASR